MHSASAKVNGIVPSALREALCIKGCNLGTSSRHLNQRQHGECSFLSKHVCSPSIACSSVSNFVKGRKCTWTSDDAASSQSARGVHARAASSSSGDANPADQRIENPFEGKPAKVNGVSKSTKSDVKKEDVKPLPSAQQAEVDKQWTQSFPTYMQSREEFESTGNWPANSPQLGKPAYDGRGSPFRVDNL
jgi:hypothetical protein